MITDVLYNKEKISVSIKPTESHSIPHSSLLNVM